MHGMADKGRRQAQPPKMIHLKYVKKWSLFCCDVLSEASYTYNKKKMDGIQSMVAINGVKCAMLM